jgi:hypothetical protein
MPFSIKPDVDIFRIIAFQEAVPHFSFASDRVFEDAKAPLLYRQKPYLTHPRQLIKNNQKAVTVPCQKAKTHTRVNTCSRPDKISGIVIYRKQLNITNMSILHHTKITAMLT